MIRLTYNHGEWMFSYDDVPLPVWIHGEKCYFPSYDEAHSAARRAGWTLNLDGTVETQESDQLTLEYVTGELK